MKKMLLVSVFISFILCLKAQNLEKVKTIDRIAKKIDRTKDLSVHDKGDLFSYAKMDTNSIYKILCYYDSTKLVKISSYSKSKISNFKSEQVFYYDNTGLIKIVNYQVRKNKKKLKNTGRYYFGSGGECIYFTQKKGQAMHMSQILYSTAINIAWELNQEK